MVGQPKTQLILICHGDTGDALVDQARTLLGAPLPLPTLLVGVGTEDDPDRVLESTLVHLAPELHPIVVTDIFGATPSNIAHRLAEVVDCPVLHGINLAMLLKAYNYHRLDTDLLVEAMLSGASAAIFSGNPNDHA